jgi:hypothetical protein
MVLRLFALLLFSSVALAQPSNPGATLRANTFTDTQTIQKQLTTATADALMCENPTAATSGNQRVSPATRWRGRGWNTGSSASQTVDYLAWVQPAQANPPTGKWILQHSTNSATPAELLSVDSSLTGQGLAVTTTAAQSNSSPTTTRAMTFNNAGSHTWTDYKFNGTLRGATGVSSSGEISLYQSGGNGVSTYNCNSGLTSCALNSYNTASTFGHYGYGGFGTGVNAGGTGTPASYLSNQGTLDNEIIYINTTGTLSANTTNVLCDASAASCTGTASTSCATHVSEGACNANDYHGGCSWYAGTSCSVFNGDVGACAGQSGCSVETASCTGAGDQSTCEAQDDPYGGSCTWDNSPTSCSAYDNDQATCESYSSYCTWTPETTADCSAFSNTDQSTCEANAGCSWADPDCTGTYVTSPSSCSGSIDSFSCNGTWNTGNCNGVYGANCSGSPSCPSIDDSTSCGAETGCTWATAIGLTLPASPPDGREYRIKNVASSGADCVIYPNTGHDIDGSSSLNLAAYNNSVMLVYMQRSINCSGLSEGACTPTGCSPTYANCSWNSGDNTCSGNAVCPAHDGNQSACESQSYYSDCSGSYFAFKRWFNMADNY